MSKYTPEELREMAEIVIEARNNGDKRAFMLVAMVAALTGLSHDDVWSKIADMVALT